MIFDWLVIGAGLTGAVLAERLAADAGQTVLVADRRDHIGGNAFDHFDAHGVQVHRYGPHIFHTQSRAVWDYLSRFTGWHPYAHRVLAEVDGRFVPVPFNLDSLSALMPERLARRLEAKLVLYLGLGARVPVLRLKEHADADLRFLGEFVYEKLFEGYTLKQWGERPEALDGSVTARVPIVVSRDSRYFNDPYQGLPRDGYTALAARLLSHPNIRLMLKTGGREAMAAVRWKHLVFTGALDEYFDRRLGALPYRSLRFDWRSEHGAAPQPAAQVNYPNSGLATRSTDFGALTGRVNSYTTVAWEYSKACEPGVDEPYYPVPRGSSRELADAYRELARQEAPEVIFAGRLADYRYYNMDQAVARALQVYEGICR